MYTDGLTESLDAEHHSPVLGHKSIILTTTLVVVFG